MIDGVMGTPGEAEKIPQFIADQMGRILKILKFG
jgi:hypothetical protein